MRIGAINGLLGVYAMTLWEFASEVLLGFPRPLDWTVNEAIVGSIPAAFAMHFGVGAVGGIVFEWLLPAHLSHRRVPLALAYAAALQSALLVIAPLLVEVSSAAIVGSIIGHGVYGLVISRR